MKNQINFIFILTLFVAAVCGCKFGNESTDNDKKEKRSATARKTPVDLSTEKDSPDPQTDDDLIADSDEKSASSNSSDMESLAGKWVWSRTGSSTVSSSGTYMGGNGSRFTYEFSEDGAVKYTGAMNVMSGSCEMLVTSVSEGQATIDGNQLNIEWQPGSTTRHDSCNSSQDYTKETPAQTQDLKIRFKTGSDHKQLCFFEKEETCFSRAE